MNYALVLTTRGHDGELERTLDAFDVAVRPRPAEGIIVDDSGDPHYRRWLEAVVNDRGWKLVYHPMRLGRGTTARDAWTLAAEAASPWIFWLPGGHEFMRAVDLTDLGHVLVHEPRVAQMAFLLETGGPWKITRDADRPYERRGSGAMRWLLNRDRWSPNPSLFRRSLTRTVPWQFDEPAFGADQEPTFGFWGDERYPYVRGIGQR